MMLPVPRSRVQWLMRDNEGLRILGPLNRPANSFSSSKIRLMSNFVLDFGYAKNKEKKTACAIRS